MRHLPSYVQHIGLVNRRLIGEDIQHISINRMPREVLMNDTIKNIDMKLAAYDIDNT